MLSFITLNESTLTSTRNHGDENIQPHATYKLAVILIKALLLLFVKIIKTCAYFTRMF